MNFRRLLLSLLASASLFAAHTAACAEDAPKVRIQTSMGAIIVELDPHAAPKTVENFLRYVKSGHYRGTLFHRVIDNFMIQGGGFDTQLNEKPTARPVLNEARHALESGLKNQRGTIAMARTEDPHSARAQFFINVRDNAFLDYQDLPEGDPVTFESFGKTVTLPRNRALIAAAGYTPFGRVTEGMDVVDQIKQVATDTRHMMPNVPQKDVIIQSITVLK